MLLGARLDLIEALGVGDQLGCVEGAAHILNELRLVHALRLQGGELAGWQVPDGGGALGASTRQCAGEHGFTNTGGGNAQVEGGLDGPAAGAFCLRHQR